MALRNFDCVSKLSSIGQLGIIDKGFCFSTGVTFPTLAEANWAGSGSWSVGPGGSNNDEFTANVSGLTEATWYNVTSYAINSMGISYSPAPALYVKTLGITNFPTVTISITNNRLPQMLYEIGTSNYLIVSGETTKNDETLFINGYLNQTSSPPPTSNPILAWNGYQPTYSTAPTVTVNFLPRANEPSSWSMKQQVFYNCGSPQYTITASTVIDALFPYLWVLKNTYQTLQSYFNPTMAFTSNYFYYESSITPNPTTPFNGKLIAPREDQTFRMTPNNASHRFLILGFPSSYGNIQYRINGGSWTTPSYFYDTNVSTGPYGANFGIVTAWTYSYNILQVQFSSYYGAPIPFDIRFV
jgi:hypothetical protein